MRPMLLLCALLLSGCARLPEPEAPSEPGRHRAALASVTVTNETEHRLEIAFRTANPPIQEIGIGRVEPGQRAQLAPVPAGEPIIFVARRQDGAVYQAPVQTFPMDGAVVWTIPKNAIFVAGAAQH